MMHDEQILNSTKAMYSSLRFSGKGGLFVVVPEFFNDQKAIIWCWMFGRIFL